MRSRKVRGHRRRWKDIDHWLDNGTAFDLEQLKEYQRDYVKVRVHPWSGLSLLKSQVLEPKGKTKMKILNGLLTVYDNWKNELDKIGEPYYLKIWLFEPRFSSSQVVCAVGDMKDYYESLFYKPENLKSLRPENYGILASAMSEFKWEHRIDEDHYTSDEVGEPKSYANQSDYEESKRWFERLMKRPHRTTTFQERIGDITETYSFKKGKVWLGEK